MKTVGEQKSEPTTQWNWQPLGLYVHNENHIRMHFAIKATSISEIGACVLHVGQDQVNGDLLLGSGLQPTLYSPSRWYSTRSHGNVSYRSSIDRLGNMGLAQTTPMVVD